MRRVTLMVQIAAALMLLTAGCDEEESKQLAEMAERHLERQAEQDQQMTQLQREVAEGARGLVEADAQSRQEMVTLQREVQAERAVVGQQRDLLEGERRELAAQRHRDPLIAAAITSSGLLLACVLPLVLCWYLLAQRIEPADDRAVAEVLLEDLTRDKPALFLPAGSPAIGVQEDGTAPQLPGGHVGGGRAA